MISSIYLTGEAGPIIDENTRYLLVSRPIPERGTKLYKSDSFPIVVKNPPGTSSQFMKIPEGTLAIVAGRVQSDEKANEILAKHGLPKSSMVVIAQLTEVYTLEANMAGYQEFFPISSKK